MSEWVWKRLVSSANVIGPSTEGAFLRSLTYNKNSNGPKMELCGTPHFTTQNSVLLFTSLLRFKQDKTRQKFPKSTVSHSWVRNKS